MYADPDQFECVTMQVQWMSFSRPIVKGQTISPPPVQDLWFIPITVDATVYRPPLHAILVGSDFKDSHWNDFVRRWSLLRRAAEAEIIPRLVAGGSVLRFALPICVFHQDPHSTSSHAVCHRAENPDAWIIHVDNGIDALTYAEIEHAHRSGARHRVAVQCEDVKRVPRQMQLNVLRRTCIQNVKEDALALLYPERTAMAQSFSID